MNPFVSWLPPTKECRSGLAQPSDPLRFPCGASSVHLHWSKTGEGHVTPGSQSGSQRPQILSYVRRRPASVVPGEGHTRRLLATTGDGISLIWEQEAAGSNPAIPTRSETFIECVGDIGGRRGPSLVVAA